MFSSNPKHTKLLHAFENRFASVRIVENGTLVVMEYTQIKANTKSNKNWYRNLFNNKKNYELSTYTRAHILHFQRKYSKFYRRR